MSDQKDCPVGPNWSLWQPCPICGALGPWFENGECVDAARADDDEEIKA